MTSKKEIDNRIEKGIQIVIDIKKKYGPLANGPWPCICGELLRFSISKNNHVHIYCEHCKFQIIE